MLRALSDIWDVAFCRGIIGFELWTVFCEECSEVCSELTGASELELFADVPSISRPPSQMLQWALSMSQAAGGCKISTTAMNSKT